MGICRDSRHKRRHTGGKRHPMKKKRKFEMGRPGAMTKIGEKRVHQVRCRGGAIKHRAIRLETGNFSWGSEVATRKTKIIDVVYNSSNNELVRTKTLVKGCIVTVDANPFKQWYEAHYGVEIGKKKGKSRKASDADVEDVKKSRSVQNKLAQRQKNRTLEQALDDQFASGRLLAAISSRPGQSGRADGYILEGKELDFYLKALNKKKGNKK